MGEGLGVRAWLSNSIHIQATPIYIPEIAADIPATRIYIRATAADSRATAIYWSEIATYIREIAADIEEIAIYIQEMAVNIGEIGIHRRRTTARNRATAANSRIFDCNNQEIKALRGFYTKREA